MRACLLIAALVLAGCQSAAERRAAETGEIEVTNASMDEVSDLTRAAREKHSMQPGLWDVRMQVVSADLSSIPAGPERDGQLAALKKQERNATRCQSAKDLKPLDLESLEKVAGKCTFPHYVSKGGKLDVEIQCTGTAGATTVLAKGTTSATGFDVIVDQTTGAPGQQGHVAIRLHALGKRLGECVGGTPAA